MDVGIFNEFASANAVGGSEFCSAVLAADLRNVHRVEIVNHDPYFTIDNLSLNTGLDLEGVRHRYLPRTTCAAGTARNPWQRYREAWSWGADISEKYDLFINLTHDIPPFCHAPRGVLLVLFPFAVPAGIVGAQANGNPLRARVRRAYHKWEWQRRLATYQLKAGIGQFTSTWARRLGHMDCPVLYPPCDSQPVEADKRNSILSVGSFSSGRHRKRQLEMVQHFGELRSGGPTGLEYSCVGGVSESMPDDFEYFEQVRELGTAVGAQVLANVDRQELRALYGQGKVFWHAAGSGLDEREHPELTEHFGLGIVDAMAAGCVPIAINKLGPAEIIRNGHDGFLCATLDEFRAYTRQLLTDEPRFREMAQAARHRAGEFGQNRFLKRWNALMGATFSDWRSTTPRISSTERKLCSEPEERQHPLSAA
jgi:glycosyltransferase involved in cell wall biosynthesis